MSSLLCLLKRLPFHYLLHKCTMTFLISSGVLAAIQGGITPTLLSGYSIMTFEYQDHDPSKILCAWLFIPLVNICKRVNL